MTNDNNAPAFEQISQSEAMGRACGLLITYFGSFIANNDRLPSPDELGDFADHVVHDLGAVRPEIKEFFQGFAEALSVEMNGAPGATL